MKVLWGLTYQAFMEYILRNCKNDYIHTSEKIRDNAMDPNDIKHSKDLINATYSSGSEPGFTHPFGHSNDVLPFIDHVAYRLPDHIMAEGGLSLHIDRNPHRPFSGQYFRPIQSWIALTDHYGGESGGLLVVPGFHLEYDNFLNGILRRCQLKMVDFLECTVKVMRPWRNA